MFTPAERKAIGDLALGRIFKLMSRPYQDGDKEQFERCRAILLEIAGEPAPSWVPSYARDRAKGA